MHWCCFCLRWRKDLRSTHSLGVRICMTSERRWHFSSRFKLGWHKGGNKLTESYSGVFVYILVSMVAVSFFSFSLKHLACSGFSLCILLFWSLSDPSSASLLLRFLPWEERSISNPKHRITRKLSIFVTNWRAPCKHWQATGELSLQEPGYISNDKDSYYASWCCFPPLQTDLCGMKRHQV